jgi:hypothetical protein
MEVRYQSFQQPIRMRVLSLTYSRILYPIDMNAVYLSTRNTSLITIGLVDRSHIYLIPKFKVSEYKITEILYDMIILRIS